MTHNPAVYIRTYGCQMNERDSEQVARQLLDRGYRLVDSERDADVVLFNTCSVRDMAEQKAIRKLEQLQFEKRKRKPQMILAMMGCVAQSRGEELLDRLPDLDLVIGTQKIHRVVDYLDARVNQGEKRVDTETETHSQNAVRDHLLKPGQPNAFVSIMQGCNMKCAFCIVPQTRGIQRSRPIGEVLAEAKALADLGVKEITLLGQIVNRYGFHEFENTEGKSPFVRLLYELEKIDGLERIRFTSPHPVGMKEDLFQAFRDLEKLCEHVHLPLQSGSDRILKAMKRAYTVNQYRRVIEKLRSAKPDMAFTTDIIVGFPGETEEDYQATRALVEEVGFDNAFIFRYSERRDTPAAVMAGKIPDSVKEERNKDLLAVLDDIAEAKSNALIGQTVEVLAEGPSKTNPARLCGRTRTNKLVVFDADLSQTGCLLPIRIQESTGFTLYGKVVK